MVIHIWFRIQRPNQVLESGPAEGTVWPIIRTILLIIQYLVGNVWDIPWQFLKYLLCWTILGLFVDFSQHSIHHFL